jgi:hypothetical protein
MSALGWQKLRFGTLVVATVAITGTTIFQATRRTVKPQDIQALTEGVQERQRAIDVATAWSTVLAAGVSTQSVRYFTNTTFTYDVPDGTNAPTSANYLSLAYLTNLVTTNDQLGMVFTATHCSHTGRVVWAGWSNLHAYAFDTSVVNSNYTLAAYRWRSDTSGTDGVVGYYTNSSRYGVAEWTLLDIMNRDLVTPAQQSARGWQLIQGTVTGTLTTNIEIRDAPAVYCEDRVNGVDWQKPSSNFWHAFDYALTNMITNFVESFDIASGSAVFLTQTGLFDTLGIGDGTNLFTQTVTSGVPVFGAIGMKLMTTNLVERYLVLQAMSQTVASAVTYSTITTNSGSNVVFSSLIDNGSGAYLPIAAGPLLGSPNYFIEPIYDSWITNASGTLIPTEWLPFTVTVSFPWFDQGYFNRAASRAFDGTFSESASNVVVTTNTSAPAHEYKWYFHFGMNSLVEWSEPPTQGYTQTITKLLQQIDVDQGDWSSNVVDATRFQTIFATDLTGATYSIDYYLLDEDRTNVLVTTYFQTGAWYLAQSDAYTWTNDIVKTNLSAAFRHEQSDFVISSNVARGSVQIGRATNRSSPSSWGYAFASVDSHTDHDAVVIYFGRRSISNRAVIRWTFKNAPP